MNSVCEETTVHIAVCACTYRRPEGLNKLLQGLTRQSFSDQCKAHFTIVIADNEVSERTRQLCVTFSDRSRLPLIYVPVAERGISHARNACLDQAPEDADFIAFIDDDEIPEPDWLLQLLRVQADTDADVVHGPVFPSYAEDTPAWIKNGGFFITPRAYAEYHDGQEIHFAATGNCLIRRSVLLQQALRFDERLALTGGEDKKFFRQLNNSGHRICWAAHAIARESIPKERARLVYLLRSEFRKGNVRLPVKQAFTKNKAQRARLAIKTYSKCLGTMASGMLTLSTAPFRAGNRTARCVSGALQLAEGLGMLSSVLGYSHRHYR